MRWKVRDLTEDHYPPGRVRVHGSRVLHGPSPVAAEPANPQVPRDRLMEIYGEFTFEAAHRLTSVPPSHKCSAEPGGAPGAGGAGRADRRRRGRPVGRRRR